MDNGLLPDGLLGLSKDEARVAFRHLVDELNEAANDAIDAFGVEDAEVDLSDRVESIADAGLKIAALASPAPVAAMISLMGASFVDAISGAVEAYEAKRNSADGLRKRIVRLADKATKATERANELEATPETEFAERVRVRILRNRVERVDGRAERLALKLTKLLAKERGN